MDNISDVHARHRRIRSRVLQLLAVVILMAAILLPLQSRAQAPTPLPPGLTRTLLLDAPTASVAQVTFAPGGRETIHTHPTDLVVIQMTAGTMEMNIGGATASARETPGKAWHIPKETPHAAGNIGSEPFSVIAVTIK